METLIPFTLFGSGLTFLVSVIFLIVFCIISDLKKRNLQEVK